MPTLIVAFRNDILELIKDYEPTDIEFHTSAHAVVATCPMNATPFGSISNGSMTANAITSDTDTGAGTITHAHFLNSLGVAHDSPIEMSVGTSGSDINITNGVTLIAGDTLEVSGLTIAMPSS